MITESQPLMLRDDAVRSVSFTPDATEQRDLALSKSALICKVENADQNKVAVAAQAELYRVAKEVEKCRTEVKKPVLDFGKKIDETAKAFLVEVNAELLRLSKLLGDFQSVEAAKAQAALNAANAEANHIERDRFTELQACTTHEQMDEVNRKYDEKAQLLSDRAPAAPVRAVGQTVSQDWEITVSDIWLLAKAHPGCVKIEARNSEIKTLLNNGVKVAGVTATRVVKSGVRLKPNPTAIEV